MTTRTRKSSGQTNPAKAVKRRRSNVVLPLVRNADEPLPRFVEPGDSRPNEFITSSLLNALLGDDVLRLFQGATSKITATPGVQGIPDGTVTDTPIDYQWEVWDRGLHDYRENPSSLRLHEEGLWLAGGVTGFDINATGTRGTDLFRQNRKFAAQDGIVGIGFPQSAPIHGLLYGYADDEITMGARQNSGGDLAITTGSESDLDATYLSPMLWVAQLTAGKTKETWTAPRTWAGTDYLTDILAAAQIRDNLRFLRSRPAEMIFSFFGGSQNINSGAFTTLTTLDHALLGVHGMYSPGSPSQLKIQRAGIYLLFAHIGFPFNTTGGRGGSIRHVTGGFDIARVQADANTGGFTRLQLIALRNLAVNDVIQLQCYQSSGAAMAIGGAVAFPSLAAIHISDAATPPTFVTPKTWNRLDAGPTFGDLNTYLRDPLLFLYGPPCCVATRAADLNTTTGVWTTVTLPTEHVDNDGMHSTASNTDRITFNRAGVYLIPMMMAFSASGTNRRYMRLVHVNAAGTRTAVWRSGPWAGSSTGNIMNGVALLRVGVGDYVRVDVFQDSGGNLNVGTGGVGISSFVGAVRIGA